MKALVAGFILIALSGAAVLWHRLHHSATPSASPAASKAQNPERIALCMVWKAQRGNASVWLCGSIHVMRESDYPLPAPYEQAFSEAKLIVMELTQGDANDRKMREQLLASGSLPDGKRLQEVISLQAREAIESWGQSSGIGMEKLQPMKPWRAALEITAATANRHGYRSSLGIERHFAAKSGDRRSAGLTTPEHQFSLFDKVEPALQEQMLLRAIAEDGEDGSLREARTTAWREGDAARLAALLDESMRDYGPLHKRLFYDRNAEWLPAIERYLDGTETAMVLVGAGHLAGPGSLIDLLAQKGVTLTQMEYRTTRPARAR